MIINNETLMPLIIESLNEGKLTSFKVKGQSMWPFYKDGKTSVYLKKSTYKKNDVVLFKYKGSYYLHRIQKINQHLVVCRGDGSLYKEFPNKSDIYGKVIFYEHTNKKKEEASITHQFIVCLYGLIPFKKLLFRVFK